MRRLLIVGAVIVLSSRLAFGHATGTCGDGVVQNPNDNGIAEICDDGHNPTGNGTAASCCTTECQFKPNCCTSNAQCDNGASCDGIETCDVASHQCQAGTPIDCDDANTCTDDHCHEDEGCESHLVALDLTQPPTLVCHVQALVDTLLGQ